MRSIKSKRSDCSLGSLDNYLHQAENGTMKTIKVGELRQNPTQMLRDVEAGDEYLITSNGRDVAKVTPINDDTRWGNNRARVDAALRSVRSPRLAALVEKSRRGEDEPTR